MKKEINEKQPKLSKHEKRLKELHEQMEYDNLSSNSNRARSISVGTAFGGTTEIMVRGDGGRHLWLIMQPVEVIELIHQLASNVGCHMAIKPREDFSSWRDWKITEQEKLHYNGWAPFVNDMAPFQQIGANMEKYQTKKLQNQQLLSLQNELSSLEDDNKILNLPDDFENLPIENKINFLKSILEESKKPLNGQNNVLLEDGVIKNKVEQKENFIHFFGGEGGKLQTTDEKKVDKIIENILDLKKTKDENDKIMATEKTVNKRKPKRSSTSS